LDYRFHDSAKATSLINLYVTVHESVRDFVRSCGRPMRRCCQSDFFRGTDAGHFDDVKTALGKVSSGYPIERQTAAFATAR
jgi:hypothetical protein